MNTLMHTLPLLAPPKESRLDLEIHEVGHQERLVVDGDVTSH
jgi:hypothetical protein